MNLSIKKQFILTTKKTTMSFIKEEDEKTRDYIFQKDTTTKSTALFVGIILVVLIIGVLISGFYFEWF